MDATSINKRVRDYLDELGMSNDTLSLGLPFFSDNQWYVTLSDGDMLLGVVVLDKNGTILYRNSYPVKS